MRVLILGLNYAPELIGVGRYTADFADWLAERGHQVRVITAPPYYPGMAGAARLRRLALPPRDRSTASTVLRCPFWVPARAVAAQAHPASAVVRAQQPACRRSGRR